MDRAVQETDLQHHVNETQLASAMMKCQSWAPNCADAGRCLQNGACFSQEDNCEAKPHWQIRRRCLVRNPIDTLLH